MDLARFPGPAALKVGAMYLVDLINLAVGMTAYSAQAALKSGAMYLVDPIKLTAGMTAYSAPAALKSGAMYLMDLVKLTPGSVRFVDLVVSQEGRTYLIDLVMAIGIAALLGVVVVVVVLEEGTMGQIDLVGLRAGAKEVSGGMASKETRIGLDSPLELETAGVLFPVRVVFEVNMAFRTDHVALKICLAFFHGQMGGVVIGMTLCSGLREFEA